MVVKNTFIDIVDEQTPESGECFRRLRVRASSDPSLLETSHLEERRQALEEESAVDFDLHGMSDSEANTEDEGVAALPCYRHIEEEHAGDVGPASAGTSSSARGSPALAPSDDVPAPGPSCASSSGQAMDQGEIDRLLSENARLAMENKMLWNKCMESQGVGPEQAGVRAQVPAAGQEAVWVPMGFVMPAPCRARIAPDGLTPVCSEETSSRLALELQRSRRQRRRSGPQRAAGSEQGLGAGEAEAVAQPRTTVMLRNLPNNYNRAMVLAMLDGEGFAGKYDFLYLPIDFKSRACLGYAFVNLVDEPDVSRFWCRFDGFSNWILPSKKVCHVSWSGPHQGLEAHIERYRNSPVMHKSVPDEYKPVVFRSGVRLDFPPPTKSTRAPRIRHISDFRVAAGHRAGGQALVPPPAPPHG